MYAHDVYMYVHVHLVLCISYTKLLSKPSCPVDSCSSVPSHLMLMILMILLPEVPSKPASNCQSNPSLNAAPKTLKFTLKKTLSSKSTPGTLKPQDRNPKPETPNRKTLKPQTISLGPFPSEYMAFWRFRFGKKVLRRRRKPEELSMGLVRVSDGCRVQGFRAPA